MFRFWESQEQQSQPRPQDISLKSWYPPSVISSPSSSWPASPNGTSSGSYTSHKPTERSYPPSHVAPAEASGVVAELREKSVDELRKLLAEKETYSQFLNSLDHVKTQNMLRDDLCKETLEIASENLEKEPQIMELRNQCRIIRTTELAASLEKLSELEKQKKEILKFSSPASLLQRVQEAMNKTEEESENLLEQLVDEEIDLATFLQQYKKLRSTYHRRALLHLAAKTSFV